MWRIMVYWLESMYLPFVDLLFLFFDRGKSLENGKLELKMAYLLI